MTARKRADAGSADGAGDRGERRRGDRRRGPQSSAANGATSSEPRIVGHGELLKALDELPGVDDARYRVAARYLSHCKPPDLTAYVKTATIAEKVGRSNRHVERCRAWLEEQGAATLTSGRGRGRSTLVDFTPLAERVKRDSIRSHFPSDDGRKNATAAPENATAAAENATETAAVMIRTLPQGPLHKDRADARAGDTGAHAPAAPKLTQAGEAVMAGLRRRYPKRVADDEAAPQATGTEGAQ
jgi:hypothetical protein